VTFNLLCYDKATKDEVFSLIAGVPKSNKYFIEGEEEVNRVIHLIKGDGPKEEDERHANMEKILKEFGLNKGLWLTEMRIKHKIERIEQVKNTA